MGRLLARLDRAGFNLEELNELVRRFFSAEDTCRFRSQPDLYTGQLVCYAELLREPPLVDWAVLIGDIVHSLRATLDNLVWELSVDFRGPAPDDPLPPGSPWRRIGFPIVTDNKRWASAEPPGGLWAIDPSLISTFKEYQPFVSRRDRPDQEALAILQELWNIDKHRHVHVGVVGVAPNLGQILALPDAGRGVVRTIRGKRTLELNTMIELFSVTIEKQVPQYVEMNWGVDFQLSFDHGPPAFGRDTIDFLGDVMVTIKAILDEFASQLT